jgi:hypothetical protein
LRRDAKVGTTGGKEAVDSSEFFYRLQKEVFSHKIPVFQCLSPVDKE